MFREPFKKVIPKSNRRRRTGYVHGSRFNSGRIDPAYPLENATPATANQSLDDHSRDIMNSSVQDLVDNDPLAAAALRTVTNAVGGDGWRLNLNCDHKTLGISFEAAQEWNKQVERLFNGISNDHTCSFDASRVSGFDAMVRTAFMSLAVTGDAFGVMRGRKDAPLGFQTCCMLIDTARVSTPSTRQSDATVINGVNIDRFGKPEGYFVKQADFLEMDTLFVSEDRYKYVRSHMKDRPWRPVMLHAYIRTRPEQLRGVSMFAASVKILRQVGDYIQAEQSRATLASKMGLYFKSNENYLDALKVLGFNPTDLDPAKHAHRNPLVSYRQLQADAHLADKHYFSSLARSLNIVEGQQMAVLKADEDIKTVQSVNNVDSFEGFSRTGNRRAMAGVGVDAATAMGDFSGLNFSAARLSLGEIYKHYLYLKTVIEQKFAMPFLHCLVEEWIETGHLTLPEGVPVEKFSLLRPFLLRGRFITRSAPIIDPVKEYTATQLKIDLGIIDPYEAAAEQGNDHDEVLEATARSNAERKKHGLPPNGASVSDIIKSNHNNPVDEGVITDEN